MLLENVSFCQLFFLQKPSYFVGKNDATAPSGSPGGKPGWGWGGGEGGGGGEKALGKQKESEKKLKQI